MRGLKYLVLVLGVLTVQHVILPRLSFLGVTPDLVLVAVIIYSVLGRETPATVFAAVLAFGQDLYARGGYWNMALKVLISAVISNFKAEFMGDEYALAALLVMVISPLYLLAELLVMTLLLDRQVSLAYAAIKLVAGTIYNLLLVPLLFPLLKELTSADR